MLCWDAYLIPILIEEGFIVYTENKATVVVSVWGARSYAALGMFKDRFNYFIYYLIILFARVPQNI